MIVILAYIALAAASLADIYSTNVALRLGLHESNPRMRALMRKHGKDWGEAKIAQTVFLVLPFSAVGWGLFWLAGDAMEDAFGVPARPLVGAALAPSVMAAYLFVIVARNIGHIRRARR